MWVPDLKGFASLLSVPQLAEKGFTITFDKETCEILRHGQLIAKGTKTNKAYYLEIHDSTSSPSHMPQLQLTSSTHAMVHGTIDTQPIEVWHKRLGHLNKEAIQKLTKLSTGMIIGTPKDQTINQKCTACLKGSQHRNISRMMREPQDKKLGCVHVDLKGPCLDKDVYGFRYFVAFTDEKTRFTRVFPIVNKSDTFGAFKTYQAQSERETGCKILALMIDGGGEFLSNEWRTHCLNQGIVIRTTQPYSPEMNGIAERVNRVLAEHASAMLWEAELPIGFWAAAVTNAAYLKNRSPTSFLECTPYEAYYGKQPNLGHVRIFGCRAQVHVPIAIRSKTTWDSHTTECFLIGHLDTENMYELWDVQKGEAIRRRDVIFWEDQLGSNLLRSFALPSGMEILPIAQQYTTSFKQHHPTISTTMPTQPHLPLKQLPTQQTVTSLPTQHSQNPVGLVFEHWDPTQLTQKYNSLQKPRLDTSVHLRPLPPTQDTQVAAIMISMGDEQDCEVATTDIGSEECQIWEDIINDHHFHNADNALIMKALQDLDNITPSNFPTSSAPPRHYHEAMKSRDSAA